MQNITEFELRARLNTAHLLEKEYINSHSGVTLISLYLFLKDNSADRNLFTVLVNGLSGHVVDMLIKVSENRYQDGFGDFIKHHRSANIKSNEL